MKTRPPLLVAAALSIGLILGQLPIMVVPALTVELADEWQLTASKIGWLGGIYFAGYALALPFLIGAASRMDGRIVYVIVALISAAASVTVALFADDFWWGLALRFIAGAGFADIHIVGMKLLADRLTGDAQARASASYTGAFAVGSGCSFLAAGFLSGAFGWEAAFLAAGGGSLLSIPILWLIGSPLAGSELRSCRLFPYFAAALGDREIVRYVVAYAGNLWEVFAVRVWFVPILILQMTRRRRIGIRPLSRACRYLWPCRSISRSRRPVYGGDAEKASSRYHLHRSWFAACSVGRWRDLICWSLYYCCFMALRVMAMLAPSQAVLSQLQPERPERRLWRFSVLSVLRSASSALWQSDWRLTSAVGEKNHWPGFRDLW